MSTSTTFAGVTATTTHDAAQGRLLQPLWRIRAEYDEMPGLCLTAAQAQRLLGLEPHECAHVLGALVDAGYLRKTPSGFMKR